MPPSSFIPFRLCSVSVISFQYYMHVSMCYVCMFYLHQSIIKQHHLHSIRTSRLVLIHAGLIYYFNKFVICLLTSSISHLAWFQLRFYFCFLDLFPLLFLLSPLPKCVCFHTAKSMCCIRIEMRILGKLKAIDANVFVCIQCIQYSVICCIDLDYATVTSRPWLKETHCRIII